jgi:hypothetical protein
MTITMLMSNTVKAARLRRGRDAKSGDARSVNSVAGAGLR